MSVKTKLVYIVDDDVSICRALSILLGTYGYKTKAFSTAEAFFSQVPKTALGCLILDIHLPGMDGWSAQRRLQNTGYRLAVVVISSDKNEGTRETALHTGALGYLQKPFQDKELVDLMNRAFSAQKGQAV